MAWEHFPPGKESVMAAESLMGTALTEPLSNATSVETGHSPLGPHIPWEIPLTSLLCSSSALDSRFSPFLGHSVVLMYFTVLFLRFFFDVDHFYSLY